NKASCSFTVTVNDNENPSISCPANITVNNDPGTCGAVVNYTAPVGTDNCPGATTSQTAGLAPGEFFPVGTTTNTFEVIDAAGNKASCSFTVTVIDNEAPAAVCQDVTVQLDADGNASVTAAQVDNGSYDNCGIQSLTVSPNTFTCADVGPNTVTLIVTDVNGNMSTCTATVTVADNIAPTAVCQDITIHLGVGGNIMITPDQVESGSTDNCGAVTPSDVVPNDFSAAGIFNVVLTVTDANNNTATCNAIVTVEKRPTTVIYSGDGMIQYSDPVTLKATLTDDLTGDPLSGKSVKFEIGSQSIVATTDATGVACTTIVVTQAPGNYTVKTSFAGDAIYTSSMDSDPFTIKCEDAELNFTGTPLVATQSATSGVANITLRASVRDITAVMSDPLHDPYAGNISNAKIRFWHVEGNTAISSWMPVSLVNGDIKNGTAVYNWPVNIGNATDEIYTVRIELGGNVGEGYYCASIDEVITVYKPAGDFITGGGFLIPTMSGGMYASAPGKKTNFGFNVKYTKNGKNLKGNMNIIFRTMNGTMKTYQIKGNAMESLGVNIANPAAKTAIFVTKANLTDITDPLSPVGLGGNLTLQVALTDKGEPGANDEIAITLWDGTTLLYSSNWIGNQTAKKKIDGGNLVVHSGFSLGSARLVETPNLIAQVRTEAIEENVVLSHTALETTPTVEWTTYPNPAVSEISIAVNSGYQMEAELTIVSIGGSVVHRDRISMSAGANLRLVDLSHLPEGIYWISLQGDNGFFEQRKCIKVAQ
ncbi:MAG: HYR domain-containing protein, partial [Saprospiraceae bacterium]|nr:HYR domain-containing protein [Saprospiraceae bacterium]